MQRSAKVGQGPMDNIDNIIHIVEGMVVNGLVGRKELSVFSPRFTSNINIYNYLYDSLAVNSEYIICIT